MTVAPGAIVSKVSSARRAGRAATLAAKDSALPVVWVDETLRIKGDAKDFNDSATGARSNVRTKRAQVPALERKMPDGTKRPVKFDGVEGNFLIERKWSIVTTKKGQEQALRQSEALSQNGLTAIWEVPNKTEMNIAVKMLRKLNIQNINVRIVLP